MKVVCCTMFSPSHNELANISVPNLREYSERHGYDVRTIMIENDKWEYKKHEYFKEYFKLLDEGDIIWYKDIDSVITNMKIPVTGFVDDKHHLFITRDVTELNGGSLIIKKTVTGWWLNELILSLSSQLQNEQNSINKQMDRDVFRMHVKVLEHPSINSYDYSIYPELPNVRSREQGHWHEGDFLLHTPGAPMEVRINTLKNAKIIR